LALEYLLIPLIVTSLFQKSYPDEDVALRSIETVAHLKSGGSAEFLSWLGGQPLSIVFANQYAKYWRVHCAKPHNNPKKDIEYLALYQKTRYCQFQTGSLLRNKYLNHRTKKTEYTQLRPFEFITRFIEHIPEKGFRPIRYFGFLANRVRGKFLSLVHMHCLTMNQT